MLLMLAVAALATAGPSGKSDVDALAQIWPGIRDSSEQTFVGTDASVSPWGLGAERRVRTIVAPVSVPWLGAHVLYLEEFLHDEPDTVRRQLLLQLEPVEPPDVGVEVHLFAFRDPHSWVHLDRLPTRVASLRRTDIAPVAGCDLRLKREADQFMGGTLGRHCTDPREGSNRYVDYQLLIGPDLYWYRRRILSKPSEDVLEEVVGFNWFELNDARLFACRVEWSATGRRSDLRPLVRLDLHDQGGIGHFVTPDGRKLELTLHSQDWPFMPDRDALILLVQDQSETTPLATVWTQVDDDEISADLGWLKVSCGSLDPDTDEVWSSLQGLPEDPGRAARSPVQVLLQPGAAAVGLSAGLLPRASRYRAAGWG
ncbi:MAG TPA: CpcT/CpeT family chromophore lyase [Steroidobacteraceae bacterium]|nr:CpcT/CpeT family chromophore lyase [Steroidobacteraceae bacterium]